LVALEGVLWIWDDNDYILGIREDSKEEEHEKEKQHKGDSDLEPKEKEREGKKETVTLQETRG